jgi:hypothetical protein
MKTTKIPKDELGNPITGIYHNVDPESYFAIDEAVTDEGIKYKIPSKSLITAASKNPEKWALNPTFKMTDSMIMGSALDCLLLTPDNFDKEFAMKPDDAPRKPTSAQLNAVKPSAKTVSAISWWRTFERKTRGKKVISVADRLALNKAIQNIRQHKYASELVMESSTQTVIITQYEGVFVKGMMDLLPKKGSKYEKYLVDLKRTSGFEPEEFKHIIRKYDYLAQAFLYRWLWEREGGNIRPRWMWLLSDSQPPFSAGLIEADMEDNAKAGERFMKKLDAHIKMIHDNNNFTNPYEDEIIKLKMGW